MCCSASRDKQHQSGCCIQTVLVPGKPWKKRMFERMWEWMVEALPAKQLCLVDKEREVVVQSEVPWCACFVLYTLMKGSDLVMSRGRQERLKEDSKWLNGSIP